METKRRRLNTQSPASSGKSPSSSKSPAVELTVTKEQLQSQNVQTRLEALQDLKKQIISKSTVNAMMSPTSSKKLFPVIVDLLVKRSAVLDNENAPFPAELKEVIGIIANCCYYSTLACLEMKQSHIRLNSIAVKIAESPLASTECKYSLIRLVANMCAHKEAALYVSSSTPLVEQICKFLESEHTPTINQALRCVQKLVGALFIRAVLVANVGYFLGKLIATRTGKIVDDAITLLLTMSKRYVRDIGRQVASSDCAEKLLELFLQGNETVQQLVVRLCGASSDIRDKFGEKGAIQKIADNVDYHTEPCCSFLSTFAQDAWGRASLRLSGALDVIIKRFTAECSNQEKMSLVLALKHFIHDTVGIAHMASNRAFVDTIVKDVHRYVEEHASPCKPSIRTNDEVFRADSPLLMEIETDIRRRSAEKEQPEQLHKDFFSLWGYNSPSPARSIGSSGNLSPPSSSAGSPVYLASPGSSAASDFQWSESTRDFGDSKSGISENDGVQRTIVDSELWLISWQTQMDGNLPYLIRVDLVDALLNYLSLAPRPYYRFERALRKIASFRIGMDKLLDMEFHTRVLNKLSNTPCRILRNARRCVRCEKCATCSRDILREFSQQVDSDFGHSFVNRLVSSPNFMTRTIGAIAKVTLTKLDGQSNAHRMAVDILFDSLKTFLDKKNANDLAMSTYPDGPPLCAQIIGALSTLIPQSKIIEMFDVEATFIPSEMVECKVLTEEPSSEEAENYLQFEENGELLAYVRMEDACKNSRYFQGMFTADMIEKTSRRRVFKFDPEAEHCASEDFLKFLHWLSGCRDECTRVKTVQTCLAMIQLSDRYLCPSLAEWICSASGPTSRLISGENLHYLLPAALSVHMHPRFLSSCCATLLRYTSTKDIIETIEELRGTPAVTDSFLNNLKEFVLSSLR